MPRLPRHPGGPTDARVADVLIDDAGAHAGDLRPLSEIHLRPRRSSAVGAPALPGLEQIIPFGRSTGGNTGDQVVAQTGGYRMVDSRSSGHVA